MTSINHEYKHIPIRCRTSVLREKNPNDFGWDAEDVIGGVLDGCETIGEKALLICDLLGWSVEHDFGGYFVFLETVLRSKHRIAVDKFLFASGIHRLVEEYSESNYIAGLIEADGGQRKGFEYAADAAEYYALLSMLDNALRAAGVKDVL